jgi:hypothetical protein
VDSGGIIGDLDIVLLSLIYKAVILERVIKIGNIIIVKGFIITIRLGGV